MSTSVGVFERLTPPEMAATRAHPVSALANVWISLGVMAVMVEGVRSRVMPRTRVVGGAGGEEELA